MNEAGLFPMALDAAVNEKFGEDVKCESTFSFMQMTYVTNYVAKGKKKKEIELFIAGWMAGHKDLSNRMHSIHHASKKARVRTK